MHKVLVAGAGNIGSLIACLLSNSNQYDVHIADIQFDSADIKTVLQDNDRLKTVALDLSNQQSLINYMNDNGIQAVIACLPLAVNLTVAKAARECDIHYFDLTEDIHVAGEIKSMAEGASSAYVPQCGLAPGFISIIANHLMQQFDTLDSARLRVGALPQTSSHALKYALTWSTDGLINEYSNPCLSIENGELIQHPALEGVESIQLDGIQYEAFNTSGGVGTLSDKYHGKINTLNYKTLRYPGHVDKMKVLLNDLKLKNNKALLKEILESSVPKTYQDRVIIYVTVTGVKDGIYLEKSYQKHIMPALINQLNWTAIQISTAAGITAVCDMVFKSAGAIKGFVTQEMFNLETFLANQFGRLYA